MNLFGQAIARELLLSFHSSSSQKCLLVLLRRQQLRQHPVAVLKAHSSLYSTTTISGAHSVSKNQKEGRYTSENPKQPAQHPEMVQKQTKEPQRMIEMEQGLKKKELVPNADWPRPSEIPWQAKVVNSVNLIGHVQIPVQFETSPDGKCWAGTVISQSDDNSFDTPPFWIPVIFEGDLAHMAVCHLKVKDRIHIAGQLSADPPPFTMGEGQANVQVMVRSINFVQGSSQMKKVVTPQNLSVADDGDPAFQSWRDLVRNSLEWWDNREDKLKGTLKPKHPDFKHKDRGASLWLDRAPKWVWSQLKGLEFAARGKSSKGDESWRNLVENPDKWWDNRTDKVKEKAPDFKHKVTGEALWLSDSPAWVLSRLPHLKAKHTDTFTKRDKLLSEAM